MHRRRLFAAALFLLPGLLASCSSGGGGPTRRPPTPGISGSFFGNLVSRATGDQVEIECRLNGTAIDGFARITRAGSGQIETGNMGGTFQNNRLQIGGVIDGENFGYDGTLQSDGLHLQGTYTLGTEAGDLNMTKTADRTAPIAGRWLGRYSGRDGSGSLDVTFSQSGNFLSGTVAVEGFGTFSLDGTIVGNLIRYGTVGGLGVDFRGEVFNEDTLIQGDYSGADSGTFELRRQSGG